jgi:DNA-binding transcriptional LysR family regulator
MPMELNHLRSFVTIARFGHLTRAAEALHLSQPALSGHVKVLEEELGVTLFDRTPSGMALTPAGEQLVAEAESILAAVAHLAQSAQALRGQPTGHLSLGTVLEPGVLRVGDLLVLALERFPQIEIELHHVMSSDALARVKSGALDASFYFGDAPDAEFTAIPLRELAYSVAIPGAWANELRGASWEAVAERPWIVAPEPSTHARLVRKLFGGELPPKVILADNEMVINNLVESGVGVSLVRDESGSASVDEGRIAIWSGSKVITRLWLVHSADRSSDPLLCALGEVLADTWTDAPPAFKVEAKGRSGALVA